MAKKIRKKKIERLRFSQNRILTFFIGVFLITAGFVTLGLGSVTFAPILLVVGFLGVVPLSFLLK